MQYQSPSQDPRLTVDERLKLLYPMVRLFKADFSHGEVVQSCYPNVNFVKFLYPTATTSILFLSPLSSLLRRIKYTGCPKNVLLVRIVGAPVTLFETLCKPKSR